MEILTNETFPSLRAERSNPERIAQKSGLQRQLRRLAMTKRPCVYIMANKRNGTIYTGVTSNLPQRAWQHREGVADGFTKRYGCKMLVWFQSHETMESAIIRENQIKAGSRKAKLGLIEAQNPTWRDLFDEIAHA